VRVVLLSAVLCGGAVVACNRASADGTRAAIALDDSAELNVTAAPAPLVAITPARVELAAPAARVCPADMILVEGGYCPEVRHQCKRYLDPPGRYQHFRCAEYAEPAQCLSKQRKPMRFCIDRDEYAPDSKDLPANHQSYTHATRTCQSLGKRVCLESEWNFACEGEAMRPYPYGFKRDPTACNADRQDILNESGRLKDLRAPGNAYPRCVSPFGVRNLAGNLEEFVSIDGTSPVAPAMKGAYWQPSRNHCRAAQTAHDRFYNGTETGFRCCSDVHR
jgi:formylglycine-generating enzyme